MILNNRIKLHHIKQEGITMSLCDTGDIHAITYQDYQINLLHGNALDGSIMNLYLRVHDHGNIMTTPLIGSHAPSTFKMDHHKVIYQGTFLGVRYQLDVVIEDFKVDYHLFLSSENQVTVDVMYGQDIAISSKSSVLNSEPYTVQYIDYKSFQSDLGYTLCARQNQGKTQFLQVGSYTKNIAYATDGFQFFGLSYKETGIPEAYDMIELPSQIYQYEFSYFALQSEKIVLNNNYQEVAFYMLYQPDFEGIIEKPNDVERHDYQMPTPFHETILSQDKTLDTRRLLSGLSVTKQDMQKRYPNMDQVEEDEHGLLSFFTPGHTHVVLKQKELLVERQHGHLMIHGDIKHVSERVMATTNWMYGVFNSHVVLGNSSFNKLLGDVRNPLNIQKISGQRIYVKHDGHYHLLGMPSYYVMNACSTRWVYVLEDDELIVDVMVDSDHLQQTLKLTSVNNKNYDLIMSHQIIMGVNENSYDINYQHHDKTITFDVPKDSMMAIRYPNLKYLMHSSHDFEIIGEDVLLSGEPQYGLLCLSYHDVSTIALHVQATFEKDFPELIDLQYDNQESKSLAMIASFSGKLNLQHPTHQNELNILMHTLYWYTHNALVHYASPHGLEQYNGAAWGTRDVCQGPIEYFMATQHFELVREILLKVYSRQFIENGDFPQWYMFDEYYQIQAHESHGDVIVWPLRALAYYLKATNDSSILQERITYMSIEKNAFVEKESLLAHVKKQISAIVSSFIDGTYLPRYGGGDWDDTLQPANHELKEKMVSGWTVALLYEAVNVFASEIDDVDPSYAHELNVMAVRIQKDYETHMVSDGIVSGFVVFDNHKKTYLLHPKDHQTGLKYRLLPLTRAMISGIATKEQVATYQDIINRYMKHPDGVRLMDTAIAYQGGKNTFFQRGETAANFGREIGLQYVHAHIRYIEAMVAINQADEAYQGLFVINPINIQQRVKNAYYRQSNMYFSSSDAWFMDRYQAKNQFDRIRQGDILVKGGWRLYSSGPGIYTHQLISHILGIRMDHQQLVMDPVLPKELDGLSVTYHVGDQPISVTYHYGQGEPKLNGLPLIYQKHQTHYKRNYLTIDRHMIESIHDPIHLEIYYQ